jgi:hypothetical protein
MALSAKVVTARVAAASTADVTVTGVGFQPKAMFAWGLGRGDTTDGAGEGNAGAGTGTDRVFSLVNGITLATQQRTVGGFTLEGAGTADTSVCAGLGFIVTCTGTATVDGFSHVSAISTDGFTVRTPNALPRSLTMGVLCLGGTDLSGSAILDVVEPATTGPVNYAHGLGVAPTAVFGIGCKVTSAATTAGVGALGSNTITLGLAKSTGAEDQMTFAGQSDEASGTIDADQYHNIGDFLSMIPDAGGAATDARAQVTALDATNVTLTWVQRAISNRRYYLLAIAGPRFHASTVTVPTALNGTVSNSGMVAQPRFGLLVHAHNTAEDTAGATVGDDSIGIGAWDSATSRHAQAYWDETGNTDTQTNTAIEFDGCLVTSSVSAGALDGVLDVSSVASDGVTYITDNDFASAWFAFSFYGMDAASGATLQSLPGTGTFAPTLTKAATRPRTLSGTGTFAATLSKAATFLKSLAAVATETATLAAVHTVFAILSAVGTFASTLTKAIIYARTLSGAGTLAATMAKVTTFARTLASSATGTVTLSRVASLFRTLSATGTWTAAMTKVTSKTLSVAGSLAAELVKAFTRLQSISASGTFTAALASLLTYTRTLSATVTGSATMAKAATFARTLAATVTNTATLTRVATFARSIVAAVVGEPTLSKVTTFLRTLSGTASGAVTLAANAIRQLAVAAAGTFAATLDASMDLIVEVVLSATGTLTASMTRAATYLRSLSATAAWAAVLDRTSVFLVSMSATVSASLVRLLAWTGWTEDDGVPHRTARKKKER